MEIVVRATVIYFFLFVVMRAGGKRELSEMSPFDLVLLVTMGDLVQQAVTQQDYSVTAGVLAVSTFALLTVALSWLQWRFPRVRPALTGRPVLVFADGHPIEDGMRRERLSLEDVLVAARQQGIRSTAEIEYAVLEADGRISFFTRDLEDQGSPEPPQAG
jgi:uncharacterized membrane protein YcaP (DUF421 family)